VSRCREALKDQLFKERTTVKKLTTLKENKTFEGKE
jgi:hypothetical protein